MTVLPVFRLLRSLPTAVLIILTLSCLPELTLQAADHGLIGSASWRQLTYQNGAFWAGLLHGWQPNYRAQPGLMFASYGFLHAGLGHLIGNMLGLGGLGAPAADRLGAWGFVWLYAASLLGGAVAFGLLSNSPAPMVGASGAVFGLAAAWVVADWQDHKSRQYARLRACGLLGALMGLNLISWALLGGQLAWQTHLGGCLAGAGFALCYPRPLVNTRS